MSALREEHRTTGTEAQREHRGRAPRPAGPGGDALDLATLTSALHPDHPKGRSAAVATVLVAGITLLDLAALGGVKTAHRREPGIIGRRAWWRMRFPPSLCDAGNGRWRRRP